MRLHRKPFAAIPCRDAARVEIDCDGTARCAASLDAALDVQAQRLRLRGRLRPIDLSLLWIAELDATGFGGGQRMACALADHVSLVLGSSGEHVKRQPVGPGACRRRAASRCDRPQLQAAMALAKKRKASLLVIA